VVFVEVSHAAGNHLDPSFDLVAVQIHEESAMGQVVGRNGAEELTVVVILVVSVGCTFVEPAEIVNNFYDQSVAFIDMVEELSHGASRIGRMLQPRFEYVKKSGGVGLDVGHPPLIPIIHLILHPVFVKFVDIVEVGLPIAIVDVGHRLILLHIGACEVSLAVEGHVDLHLLEDVAVHCFELIQPLQHVLLNYKEAVEHLLGADCEVLGPLHYVRRCYDDPVAFVPVHGHVG